MAILKSLQALSYSPILSNTNPLPLNAGAYLPSIFNALINSNNLLLIEIL